MPKLIIDNRQIEVPRGTKVIEAAERLGIVIPRFCFHPSLGSLGACRVCAVKFLEGPVKGIRMSCMEEAREGMVVSTTHAEAIEFRRLVVEWLMMNHPHDCPVCDEGGHCLLQDLTVAGGHGLRRYPGKKRTYNDQDLGPLIRHEMNRCIHCFRCRRFYQDFAGYRDFGALQIGSRMYFGRFENGPLESPFSGNIIDLCPTGVLTDKPSRYRGRRWDYERSPSLCLHCSLGCRVVASVRYREVVRLEAGFSRKVNGYFICDRGRYGFDYVNHPQRPRRPRVGEEEVSPERGLTAAVERLSQTVHQFGKGAVACLGSGRSSLETLAGLKRFCQKQGFRGPVFPDMGQNEKTIRQAVDGLDGRTAVSLREIEDSDFLLLVAADPLNEAPMLALAMRQAARKGAPVYVLDPRPVSLPHDFEYRPFAPDDLDLALALLRGKALGQEGRPKAWAEREIDQHLEKIGQGLLQSRRPVVICGTGTVRPGTPGLAVELVLSLQTRGQGAGIFYLLPEANSFAAAWLSSPDDSILKVLEAVESGSVNGLVVVEADPFRCFPDRSRLEEALNNLDFLLVLDFLPSVMVERADVFLPTRTIFEAGGIYVNQEGRAQWAPRVFGGGLPVRQIGAGSHPPHTFGNDIPGGEPLPAWQVLEELSRHLSPDEEISPVRDWWADPALTEPFFSRLGELKGPGDEIRLVPEMGRGESPGMKARKETSGEMTLDDSIEILPVDWTFGTEELSAYSGPVRKIVKMPWLMMPSALGQRLGIDDRDRAVLSLDRGPLEVEVRLSERMAPKVMLLPRHDLLDWQKISSLPVRLSLERIKKRAGE